MKRIPLIIFIAFLIFQIVVTYSVMVTIYLGSPVINRPGGWAGETLICKESPASAKSYIHTIEVWAVTNLYNCVVATFENTGGNDFTVRDNHAIGTVAGGAKRTFSGLNLLAHAGDYIGFYGSSGMMETNTSGGQGVWHYTGDHTSGSFTFVLDTNNTISLRGTATVVLPGQVMNVQATDGVYTDKVRVTWNVESEADKYYVWNGASWVDVGLVTTWDHTGAPAPTITHGSITASDGSSVAHVALSNTGASANNGSSISYKVKAWNIGGYGPESASNSGYRGPGALTYQWYRSAADSDASYSSISGATSSTYNDTGAPAPTITAGTASASDETSRDYVTLSIAGESANIGAGRYYKCYHTATGATSGYTGVNRGYRGVGSLTYQWQRSAVDSDADYSNVDGATTDPYNDTGAPVNGDGRYYKCIENATGATQQTTNADRGYRLFVPKSFFFGSNI